VSAVTQKQRSASIPGDLAQVLTVARYELLRHLRRRRFLAMLAIIAVVVTLILALPPALGVPQPSDPYGFSQNLVQFTAILVLLAATFFAADGLAGEFHQRTGYVVFPNPIRRASLYWGKVLAGLGASLGIVGTYYGIVAVASLGFTGRVVAELGLSALFAFLYTASAVGVAYLVSAVMKGTTGATILTFLLFLFVLPIASTTLTFAKVKPMFLVTFASETLTNVLAGPFPEAYPQDSTIVVGPGFTFTQYVPEVVPAVAVMALYLVVSVVLARMLFARREMTG